MLPKQIPPGQKASTAVFDTRKCHDAFPAGKRGCRAYPAPQERQVLKTRHRRGIARNEILPMAKRLGRTIWQGWGGCHRRSVRDFDRQLAKLQLRLAVWNGFTAPVHRARHKVRGISLSGEGGALTSHQGVQRVPHATDRLKMFKLSVQ